MKIANRHVRRNWYTWIDQPEYDGKTSRALCGKRTRQNYIGIPAITNQPVEVDGEPGWCWSCMKELQLQIHMSAKSPNPNLNALIDDVAEVISKSAEVYIKYLKLDV